MTQAKFNVKQLLHYAISVGTTGIVYFLPILILVRLLPPDGYAKIVLVKNALFIFVSLAGFGMSQSVVRWVNSLSNTKVYINSLVGVSIFAIPACLIMQAIFYFLGNKIGLSFSFYNFLILLAIILMQLLNFEMINWKRAEHKSLHYSSYTFVRGVMQVSAIIIAVYYFRTLHAYLVGLLIAEFLFLIMISYREIHSANINLKQIDLKLTRQMFMYGWPNSLVIVSGILLNTVDRYMISLLQPNQALVAYYDAGYILSTAAIYMLGRTFNLYMFPAYMKAHKEEGPEKCSQLINKTILLYLLVSFLVVIPIVALRYPLLHLFFPAPFSTAAIIITPVCLGVLLNGLINGLTAGLYITGRSWAVGITSASALALNIGLNFYLIPKFGLIGAAYSTLFAFGLQILIGYIWSKRYLKVKLPIAYLCLGFAVVYGIMLAT